MGRKLSDNEKKYFLGLKPEDITFDLLNDLFADKVDKSPVKMKVVSSKYSPQDEFVLEAGEYFNKEKVTTNIGLFIFNKLIIERELIKVLGYVNDPINKDVQGKMENKLSKALLNDEITVDDMVNYLNRTQWLAMQFHSVICGSFTMKTLKPSPTVITMRNKLLKENKDKIESGDVVTAVQIEQKLLDTAKSELKGDPGMDLYNSGARGSFSNNYKAVAAIKGPVFNPTTGEWDIVQSNFMEGIRKEELPVYGNAIITGAYPKAVGTQVSGYFSKQITAALQAVVLDKPGSDCGSKGYLKIILTPQLVGDFMYRYMVEGSKLVLLDEKNVNNYIGREIKFRSPMYCIGKKLCRACAGQMYDKLQIDNIGMTAARVSSTLLNLNMKKFHDSTAKISKININELIL
jgi:hypothetical protein